MVRVASPRPPRGRRHAGTGRDRYGEAYAPAVPAVREIRQKRAFATLGGPVEVGGDPVEGEALAGLFDVDPGLARALTHGFHTYAGRMHPSIARGAVSRWSGRGDTVLDPFCGSGTVLVESMASGRASFGVDASPLAVAIARVRTTLLGPAGRARLLEAAAALAETSAEEARKRRPPEVPPWARREFERFHPHVAFELLGLRALIMATPEDDVGRALRLCLSSILVKVMKAGPEAPRDGVDKRIARGVPSRLLSDRAQELAAGLEALERRMPSGTPPPRVELGDARRLAGVPDRLAALVLSSPPYAGTYDYAAQHDVRFKWLDLPRRKMASAQIGARADVVGSEPRAWHEDRRRWMGEVARCLRPGGHAVLVVGDGVVGGAPEDAPAGIAEAAGDVGLVPVARASQARPVYDRRLQAIFAGRPRLEHILLLRRA